ncbi:MAG: protein-export chaperone SecB [Alcanivorax sp.]|nr:MAG: protein-export chaperone SecB [Alcanivorax sp.]
MTTNIPLPPLRLDNYFFKDITVEPRSDYSPPEDGDNYFDFSDILVSCTVSAGKGLNNKGEEEHYVILEIETDDGEKRQTPYRIKCTVFGILEPHPDLSKDQIQEIIPIQGATLLYGSARDFLMTITARMGHGPLLLPTLSFHNLLRSPVGRDKEG